VRYDDPKVIEALQYWVDLSRKHGVHPPGVVEWGTTPKDFFEKKVAMIWTTTGNLTNIRTNAKFDFGVAMLPAGKKRGSPTGGGNFYIFKKATPAQQEAAFKFARWLTTPERAAQWGIDTGYVAVSPAAWDTPAMKKYAADFAPATGGARPAAARRGRAVHARQPARDQGAERRPAGRADRRQDARAGDEGRAEAEAERLLRSYKSPRCG
jgi:sn-glycerol 3-phosphate transport system substrate-binding protein